MRVRMNFVALIEAKNTILRFAIMATLHGPLLAAMEAPQDQYSNPPLRFKLCITEKTGIELLDRYFCWQPYDEIRIQDDILITHESARASARPSQAIVLSNGEVYGHNLLKLGDIAPSQITYEHWYKSVQDEIFSLCEQNKNEILTKKEYSFLVSMQKMRLGLLDEAAAQELKNEIASFKESLRIFNEREPEKIYQFIETATAISQETKKSIK